MKMAKNTAAITRYLLRNRDRNGHNINQLARTLKISVGSAFKILKGLENKKILNAQSIGNARYYKLDLGNNETVKLCELLLLEEKRQLTGYAKLYAEELQKFENAELIMLFGSILHKKEFNDVDAVFVTDKTKETSKFCLQISKMRTKPVVPLILTKKGIISELKAGNPAILSAFKEGIVLKGESIFIEVLKNAV